ncbi:hypothetical protein EB232_10525 [Mesorhizobium sp. NZP2077]|nr:hypothetical protein EB232_10525 [Mesorhizobium sp. NZP2077]
MVRRQATDRCGILHAGMQESAMAASTQVAAMRGVMIGEGPAMKKRYEKPTLDKRQRLSSVTAACTPSTCVN